MAGSTHQQHRDEEVELQARHDRVLDPLDHNRLQRDGHFVEHHERAQRPAEDAAVGAAPRRKLAQVGTVEERVRRVVGAARVRDQVRRDGRRGLPEDVDKVGAAVVPARRLEVDHLPARIRLLQYKVVDFDDQQRHRPGRA